MWFKLCTCITQKIVKQKKTVFSDCILIRTCRDTRFNINKITCIQMGTTVRLLYHPVMRTSCRLGAGSIESTSGSDALQFFGFNLVFVSDLFNVVGVLSF